MRCCGHRWTAGVSSLTHCACSRPTVRVLTTVQEGGGASMLAVRLASRCAALRRRQFFSSCCAESLTNRTGCLSGSCLSVIAVLHPLPSLLGRRAARRASASTLFWSSKSWPTPSRLARRSRRQSARPRKRSRLTGFNASAARRLRRLRWSSSGPRLRESEAAVRRRVRRADRSMRRQRRRREDVGKRRGAGRIAAAAERLSAAKESRVFFVRLQRGTCALSRLRTAG